MEELMQKAKEEYAALKMNFRKSTLGASKTTMLTWETKKDEFDILYKPEDDILWINMNLGKAYEVIKKSYLFSDSKWEKWLSVSLSLIQEIAKSFSARVIIKKIGKRDVAIKQEEEILSSHGFLYLDNLKDNYFVGNSLGEYARSQYLNIEPDYLEKKEEAVHLFQKWFFKHAGKTAAMNFCYQNEGGNFNRNWLYAKGYDTEFDMIFKDGLFQIKTIKKEKEEYILIEEEEIGKWVDKINKRQRLRNLVNPPRYHYDKRINEISFTPEIRNSLYDHLLKYYHPEQIEHYFSDVNNASFELNRKSIKSLIFFELMEIQFFIISNKLYSFQDKKEMSEKAKELLIEKNKKEIHELMEKEDFFKVR